MRNIKLISFMIASIPALASIGCGRIPNTNVSYAPDSSLATLNTTSLATQTAANFSCPNTPNVVPTSSQYIDGRDEFTVCTSKISGDFSNLLVTGNYSASNSLCGIPVQMLSPNNFKLKTDIQGNIVYSCSAASAAGVYLSNPQANSSSFNAIILVESPYLNRMISCAQNGLANCPEYSFGRIR